MRQRNTMRKWRKGGRAAKQQQKEEEELQGRVVQKINESTRTVYG